MDINPKLEKILLLNKECIDILKKHDLFEILIKKELVSEILQSITLNESQILELKTNFIKQKTFETEDDYKNWLKTENIKEKDLIDKISNPLKLAQFCNKNFSHKAEARFLKRKNDLDKVVYSLIRLSDPFLARELRFRLVAKEANFEDLATSYSEGIEKHSKGIVGPIGINKAHPGLSEYLRKWPIGEILGPISVNNLHLIFRIEERYEAKLNDEMIENMNKELFEEWLTEKTNQFIYKLKTKENSTQSQEISTLKVS